MFQDCTGKNVAMHQETVFAKANFEVLKQVMDGAIVDVAVKGKPNATLGRIPYIITCNVEPWIMGDPRDQQAFVNRCFKYEITFCPHVKKYSAEGLIHPSIWRYLVEELDAYNKELDALMCNETMPMETRSEATTKPGPSGIDLRRMITSQIMPCTHHLRWMLMYLTPSTSTMNSICSRHGFLAWLTLCHPIALRNVASKLDLLTYLSIIWLAVVSS